MNEIKLQLSNQNKQIDISLYETIIKKLNNENVYYEQQLKKLIDENKYLKENNNSNINIDSEEYKKEIEKKINELESIKKETIQETLRLKEENDKISHNIESQNKLKNELLEIIKYNKNKINNTEKSIIIKDMITNLNDDINNISCIELNGYNIPNIINNINDDNNLIKFIDHNNNNNEYIIKINNGYYTNKNICKELNNNQYYETLGIKFNLDNITHKISIKSNNNISLLYTPLLDFLGFNNDDNILKNQNNIIASNIIKVNNDKIIYVYIMEINRDNPLFQIMLNTNKINTQKIDLYPYIDNLNKLTLEFRDSKNKIIKFDNFSFNIIIKSLLTNNTNDNITEINETNLYDKLMMSYC